MMGFPKPQGRVLDADYIRWVRQQPCCLAVRGACSGPVEADHAGPRPVGRRADDRTCIPLCRRHHRQRTDYRGHFYGWTAETMRAWLDARIAETQADYAARFGLHVEAEF